MNVRLVLAIAAVWLFWGSTFAAMRATVQTIPPFPMAATRFLIAGALVLAACAVRGGLRITRSDLLRASVTGGSLLLFGNGVAAWTVQYLPSGLNSLLLSAAPIWMAIIAYAWGGERPTRLAVAGMVLGLGGLALLLHPAGAQLPLWPALVSVLASVSWAFGSIYQRRTGRPDDLLLATALQLLAGGAMLAIEAALTGQWGRVDLHAVAPQAWIGLAWLVVFGSIVGYLAYLYTMSAAGTALASTYAYVNPLVAVGLGAVLFGERLSAVEAVAGVVILAGVVLMVVPPAATREAAEHGAPACTARRLRAAR